MVRLWFNLMAITLRRTGATQLRDSPGASHRPYLPNGRLQGTAWDSHIKWSWPSEDRTMQRSLPEVSRDNHFSINRYTD
ncbi:hypothetical protein BDV32DRAFT_34268 [Aspergillus pseudonomiae]|nr:hypothetical protein BDV32DRAFT_34268 [Aspergillus pseudonomiae]